MENKYLEEEKGYTLLLAYEEASRCLLCEDAPCSKGCPAGTNPAKFIRSIRFKNLLGAIDTIRSNNPLGGICGRVCPTEKYCELECSRQGLDKPINIGKLQRFLTDYEKEKKYEVYEKPVHNGKHVAIIGAGPSGITAANMLARLGYEVTIFEEQAKAGGYMTYGIPEFRLPQEVVDQEIQYTLNLGVKIVYNVKYGRDISISSLNVEGYEAIIMATGYQKPFVLDMFNDNKYVETATDFLKEVKTSKGKLKMPKSILVVGGGDVSMDVCLSAKKLGVSKVIAVARETLDVFPASNKEFEEASKNNVSIFDGFTPVSVDNNKVTFKSVDGDVLNLSAEKIILALGQKPEQYDEFIYEPGNAKAEKAYKNVFVTGDLIAGDKTLVYAIRKGKETAEAVHQMLGGNK